MAISFHQEGVSFQLKHKIRLKGCIKASIVAEKRICGQISIVFCSDEYLLSLNRQFLHHDYYTDVITFDYSSEKSLSGDIFISLERVEHNAFKNRVEFENELYRVIIHGVMHLAGYKDKKKTDIASMRKAEEKHLKIWMKILAATVSRGTQNFRKK